MQALTVKDFLAAFPDYDEIITGNFTKYCLQLMFLDFIGLAGLSLNVTAVFEIQSIFILSCFQFQII
jgi:hypothetical protein